VLFVKGELTMNQQSVNKFAELESRWKGRMLVKLRASNKTPDSSQRHLQTFRSKGTLHQAATAESWTQNLGLYILDFTIDFAPLEAHTPHRLGRASRSQHFALFRRPSLALPA
jgi:hypothetical protein